MLEGCVGELRQQTHSLTFYLTVTVNEMASALGRASVTAVYIYTLPLLSETTIL